MAVYLFIMFALSLALAYVMAFSQATLFLGKSLSNTDSPRGFQDAITPPASSKFAIWVYVSVFVAAIYGIWAYWFIKGVLIVIGFYVLTAIISAIAMPKHDSQHFRNTIIKSLIRRHADYSAVNDKIRALIIAEFLEKLGFPINDLVSSLRKPGDV